MQFWNISPGATKQSELTDVTTPHVAADIAADAIVTAKILDGDITAAKLGTDIAIGGVQNVLLRFYNSIGQGTYAHSISATYDGNYQFESTTDADGDNVSYKVYLPAGTYKCHLVHNTGPTSGITDIEVDGNVEGSLDFYTAGGVGNATSSVAGIVIATTGLKTITLKTNGKNGASGGYKQDLIKMYWERTA